MNDLIETEDKKGTLKNGEEVSLKINDFKSTIGTINRKDGKCVYLVLSGYVKPQDGENLELIFNKNKHLLKKHVLDGAHQLFNLDKNMPPICILNHSQSIAGGSGRANSVWTYFDVDMTFYFKEKTDIKENELIERMSLILYSVVDFLDEIRELNFAPKRR